MKKNFLIGGALAAQQCEGAYQTDGKGDAISDHLTAGGHHSPRLLTKTIKEHHYYPSHRGIEFYQNFEEDMKLLGELGINALRLSISWSRIFPNGDDLIPNEDGLIFYDHVFDTCHKYGIEPIVTLCHNDMPYNLTEKYHGWYDRQTIEFYVNYTTTVMERYKHKVKYWLPFNEINGAIIEHVGMFMIGYFKEIQDEIDMHHIPDHPDIRFQSLHHMLLASAKTVMYGKKIHPDFQFGAMLLGMVNYPYTCHPKDNLLALQNENIFVDYCADVLIKGTYTNIATAYLKTHHITLEMEQDDLEILKKGTVDFYSFSYYSSTTCSHQALTDTVYGNLIGGNKNPYLKETEWNWTMDPDGLHYLLLKSYKKYHIPMMIVENGLGANDHPDENFIICDDYRINYIQEHLCAIKKAMEDGVDVMGYMLWGIIDLMSASTGEMSKRYGLIYVDLDNRGHGTFQRKKKKSYHWFQKAIKEFINTHE